MAKEGSTKIVNFMTPGEGVPVLERGQISHSENALILFLFIYSSLLRGIYIINWAFGSNDKKRVCQNCKFHDPMGGRRVRIMYNFDDVYQYSIFIANVQSTAIIDFYLVYDGSVDMKIWLFPSNKKSV